MGAVCSFISPDLVEFVSGSIIPTFAVNSANTNFLSARGVFTNNGFGLGGNQGETCTFASINFGQGNPLTVTPYLVDPAGATTSCAPLTAASPTFAVGVTYTDVSCPQITLNALQEGTYMLGFNTDGSNIFDPEVVQNTFVITTPLTAETTTSITTTTADAPTTTVTSRAPAGTDTSTTSLAPLPSSTSTSTIVQTSTSTVTTTSTKQGGYPVTTVTAFTKTITSTIRVTSKRTITTTLTAYKGGRLAKRAVGGHPDFTYPPTPDTVTVTTTLTETPAQSTTTSVDTARVSTTITATPEPSGITTISTTCKATVLRTTTITKKGYATLTKTTNKISYVTKTIKTTKTMKTTVTKYKPTKAYGY